MTEHTSSFDQGVEAFGRGDFKGAVSLFEAATRESADDYESFVYLGIAYSQLGRYNAAIGALKRASEIRPNSPVVHYNLGQAYEAADVPNEAWSEYSMAMTIDPMYARAKNAMESLSRRLPEIMSSSMAVD